jgi:hypothetical protein
MLITLTERPSGEYGVPLRIRIAAVPCGAGDAFVHPACVSDLSQAEYHDLTVVELLDQQIVYCDSCGERILPRGVERG